VKPSLLVRQSDPLYPIHLLLPYLHKAFQYSKPCAFTLKMANAFFAETLDNFQHSTQHIPESRSLQ
jgi:hypothetical protein